MTETNVNTPGNVTPALLRRNEAAEYLGLASSTLANLYSRGEGPTVVHIGRAVRYRRRDLDQYIEALPTTEAVA